MRSWSASRTLRGALALALALASAGPAEAASVESGLACLEASDLPCARAAVDALRDDGERGAGLDVLEARVLFWEGDFARAAELLAGARGRATDERTVRQIELYQETARVHEGLVETRVDDVVVVHHPGVDRILVQDAVDALSAAKERIAPLLGGAPPGPIRVEIYPDGHSFVACSGLPLESVQTTGVIAISKWNRLLLTSPRATGRGYGWQDTLVHEWIHQVVAWHTKDRAPVWLQEGIAKGLDMLWRLDAFELPVQKQSLLSQALATGEFVTFEQMHPSMAYLPTADMAGLAYAQVSTMMEFLQQTQGQGALIELQALVRAGEDAREATAQVYGEDFDTFEADWKIWIGELDLVGAKLQEMPTVLDGLGDEFSSDPVLSEREDLAGKTRLGDLMAQRGHFDAALIYYEQAVPEDEPLPPLLARRTAQVLLELERGVEARSLLEENLGFYPEIAANHELLAQLYLDQGRSALALEHYRESAAIYPYDSGVQGALAELYDAGGDADRARLHRGYVDTLTYRDASF